MLKPQDIVVLLKVLSRQKEKWSYNELAVELDMSASEVHAAIKRALEAGLAIKQGDDILPNSRNLEEFIIHGLQYVFVPKRGELTRGVVTSYASAPLKEYFVADEEPPPIWPDAEGDVRGMSFSPLYRSVPGAAKNDPELYEWLTLVDAIRGGRVREKQKAIELMKRKFKQYDSIKKSKS